MSRFALGGIAEHQDMGRASLEVKTHPTEPVRDRARSATSVADKRTSVDAVTELSAMSKFCDRHVRFSGIPLDEVHTVSPMKSSTFFVMRLRAYIGDKFPML